MEAIEDWPFELRGVPPVETLTNGDGTRRVRFVRRSDGAIQFFAQELRRCETDGQEYLVWYSEQVSGLYPDLATARHDAVREISWLRDSS